MSTDNPSSVLDNPKAKFWGNVAKYGFLVFGFAFLAPVFWLAVGGLIGAVLFGGILVGTWMLRPWVFMKAANLRLKLIKAEAAKNPVETLQAEHLRQSELLEERKKGVEAMGGAVRTLAQAISNLEQEFPDSPELPQMHSDQAELNNLLKSRQEDWKLAYISLGDFAKEINRVGKLWEVSLAAAKARQQSGLTEDEWMSKLKTQTSIDAIRTQLNTQLSALNSENMQAEADRILKGRTALPAPAARATINITNTTVKSAQKV